VASTQFQPRTQLHCIAYIDVDVDVDVNVDVDVDVSMCLDAAGWNMLLAIRIWRQQQHALPNQNNEEKLVRNPKGMAPK
jgi:hypothetical protein